MVATDTMPLRPTNRFLRLGTRESYLCALLLVFLVVWAAFHSAIDRSFAERLLLSAQSPSEESFQRLAENSPDPAAFLARCWHTARIPHRQLVAAFLKATASAAPPWFERAEPLLLAGSVDPDTSVRELALATLEMRGDPRLFDQARALLSDVDPYVRQLGLQYLRRAPAQRGVPLVIPLLDDPDLQVVARAEAALTRWTGQDFGVRVRFAIQSPEGVGDPAAVQADEQKIREGVARRKQWWTRHSREFAPLAAAPVAAPTQPELTQDFSLPTPAGSRVRLFEYRGRVVVLNFWATWCTACLEELPNLAALQRESGGRIAILGVALDGLPDEHQHPSNSAGEAEDHSVGKSLEQIQSKVLKAVQARGINYTVLLDPTGAIGARFNGGELPTTVIIDPTGHVRRRFIGKRSLPVFEAMVAEAAKAPL